MKTTSTALFYWLIISTISAQEWIGYNTSNYAGIHAVQYNPALITQTHYGRYDISLIAANVHAENNYFLLNGYTLRDPVNTLSDRYFMNKYVRQNLDGSDKSAIGYASIQSPSFLIQVSKRDAIGFCARSRVFINVDGVDETMAKLMYPGPDSTLSLNTNFMDNYTNAAANLWMEYDFTYARTLYVNHQCKLKGGVTLKLLQGLGGIGMDLRNYQFGFNPNDTSVYLSADARWGASKTMYDQNFVFDFSSPGFAVDIGFVFEYTPDKVVKRNQFRKRRKKNIHWPGILTPDETSYKFRLGFSVNDLGAIFYKRVEQTRDFNIYLDTLAIPDFGQVNSVATLNTAFQNNFNMNGTESRMTMAMPTHINVFGDVRFPHNFALHTNFLLAFNQGKSTAFKNHFMHQITLTPRWEIKWFGVYVPIWVNQNFNSLNMGLSVRLGPLVIGTGDLFGHLFREEYSSIDLHMALRLTIPHFKSKNGSAKHQPHYHKEAVCKHCHVNGETVGCENFKPY